MSSQSERIEYPPRCKKHGDQMIYREVGKHAPGYTVWECQRCEDEASETLRKMFPATENSRPMREANTGGTNPNEPTLTCSEVVERLQSTALGDALPQQNESNSSSIIEKEK